MHYHIISGIGYYISENMIYNSDGKLLTDRTWTYKPPVAKDIPVNFRIMFPENNPNPNGILKSKGTKLEIMIYKNLPMNSFLKITISHTVSFQQNETILYI